LSQFGQSLNSVVIISVVLPCYHNNHSACLSREEKTVKFLINEIYHENNSIIITV
jgi:hypothetical protein